MNKANNFARERRNRKNHSKPYDRVLEATQIQVSSNMDVNVLQSRNNYLCFGITYPTGGFSKDNTFLIIETKQHLWIIKKYICYFAWRLHYCWFPQVPQNLV